MACGNTPNALSDSPCVDDFGVKYTNKADAQHLVDSLAALYEISTDWTIHQVIIDKCVHPIYSPTFNNQSNVLQGF
jgi:hypothetical protein